MFQLRPCATRLVKLLCLTTVIGLTGCVAVPADGYYSGAPNDYYYATPAPYAGYSSVNIYSHTPPPVIYSAPPRGWSHDQRRPHYPSARPEYRPDHPHTRPYERPPERPQTRPPGFAQRPPPTAAPSAPPPPRPQAQRPQRPWQEQDTDAQRPSAPNRPDGGRRPGHSPSVYHLR